MHHCLRLHRRGNAWVTFGWRRCLVYWFDVRFSHNNAGYDHQWVFIARGSSILPIQVLFFDFDQGFIRKKGSSRYKSHGLFRGGDLVIRLHHFFRTYHPRLHQHQRKIRLSSICAFLFQFGTPLG